LIQIKAPGCRWQTLPVETSSGGLTAAGKRARGKHAQAVGLLMPTKPVMPAKPHQLSALSPLPEDLPQHRCPLGAEFPSPFSLPLFHCLFAKKMLWTCVLVHTTAVAAVRLLLLLTAYRSGDAETLIGRQKSASHDRCR
jgi:hypothetical protein